MDKLCLSFLTVLLVSGCTQTVWVYEKAGSSEDAAKSIDGIPFFAKVEKYDQETKWGKSWIKVTLKIEKTFVSGDADEKRPTITQSFSRNFTQEQLPQLSDIKKQILTLSEGNDLTAKSLVDKFLALSGLDDVDNVKEIMVSNALKPEWVVDSSKTYYLNAPLPWFGTNTLSQKLNADGTLAETSSAPDTKLSEGITSLIPINEYLTGKYVTPLNKEPASNVDSTLKMMSVENPLFSLSDAQANIKKASFVYQISIDIEETGYRYTFTRQCDVKESCVSPISFDLKNGFFVREPISITPVKKDSEKAEANSISFQGAITLPKEDEKPKESGK